MIFRLASILAVLGGFAVAPAPARAQSGGEQLSTDEVLLTTRRVREAAALSVYGGVWTNSRFATFPVNLVTGKLTFRDSHLAGLIASYPLTNFSIPLPGRYRLDGFTIEAEGSIFKHFGLQNHAEANVALVIRTGQIKLPGDLSMNFAFGNGFSYAFSDAALEIGRLGLPGVDTYKLQYHMSAETAFSLKSAPNVSLFLRLHHRSGIYGVISPRRSGSNFVGGGLRWTFL